MGKKNDFKKEYKKFLQTEKGDKWFKELQGRNHNGNFEDYLFFYHPNYWAKYYCNIDINSYNNY